MYISALSQLLLVSLEFTQGDNMLLILTYEVAKTGYFIYQSFTPPAELKREIGHLPATLYLT